MLNMATSHLAPRSSEPSDVWIVATGAIAGSKPNVSGPNREPHTKIIDKGELVREIPEVERLPLQLPPHHVQKSSTKSGHAHIQQCTGFSGSCLSNENYQNGGVHSQRSRQKKPESTKEWIVARWSKGP